MHTRVTQRWSRSRFKCRIFSVLLLQPSLSFNQLYFPLSHRPICLRGVTKTVYFPSTNFCRDGHSFVCSCCIWRPKHRELRIKIIATTRINIFIFVWAGLFISVHCSPNFEGMHPLRPLRRWATIVCFAMERLQPYEFGRSASVETDHKHSISYGRLKV
jgi:hypothetical protein